MLDVTDRDRETHSDTRRTPTATTRSDSQRLAAARPSGTSQTRSSTQRDEPATRSGHADRLAAATQTAGPVCLRPLFDGGGHRQSQSFRPPHVSLCMLSIGMSISCPPPACIASACRLHLLACLPITRNHQLSRLHHPLSAAGRYKRCALPSKRRRPFPDGRRPRPICVQHAQRASTRQRASLRGTRTEAHSLARSASLSVSNLKVPAW